MNEAASPDLLLTREVRAALRASDGAITAAAIREASYVGAGWNAVAFRVGSLLVRVPRVGGSTEAFAREAALIAALEARGVAGVPRGARVLTGTDGAPLATVYEYVDGFEPLPSTFRGYMRERFARDLGVFLGALHSFPATQARALGVKQVDLYRGIYEPLIADCRPHLAGPTQTWVDSLTERFLADGGSKIAPRVLIHGDISAPHTLARPDGTLAGVIDFEDAMLADPALDFGGVLNEHSLGFLERVLHHYPRSVDPDARRRAAYYIAVAPLHSVREAVRRGDPAMLAAARRKLGGRARRAVVPGAAGP